MLADSGFASTEPALRLLLVCAVGPTPVLRQPLSGDHLDYVGKRITELHAWTVGQFLLREVEVAKQTTVTRAPDGRQRGALALDAEPPGGPV